MSTLRSPAGIRAARPAIAAVERARLALVPTRRMRAPRAPFAVLVLALLGAGVVGLLMFNTHMQQASFYATQLQNRADDLASRSQSLDMELDRLRDPQRLAEAGKSLGMVAPSVPAFVNLSDGRVVGTPTAAVSDDAVRINPLPAALPAPLKPRPIIKKVYVPATTGAATGIQASPRTGTQTPPATGPASTAGTAATGRNGAASADQGAPR